MGCDIHCMYEREDDNGWYKNSGDPDIGRNYTIFSILGNVRNEGLPYIAENRITVSGEYDIDWKHSGAFCDMVRAWACDGHSHSYVTLKELKDFDISQKYHSHRLITSKDDNGKITGTCSMTTGEHMGEVGEVSLFGVWGDDSWQDLINYGENIRAQHKLTDEQVRLVFFFDN